jgi:hypothetical protein
MLYEYLDDKGRHVNIEKIEKGHALFDRAHHHRTNLVEALSNYDEKLADMYLAGTPVEEIDQLMIE